MSRRRRKSHADPSHERWLVSYADFITLLFAFFVVLYASSQVDKKKMIQVAAAIQGGFRQMGVFSPTPADAPTLQPGPLVNDLSKKEASSNHPEIPLSQVKSELERALSEEISKHQVEMRSVPDGLVVSLREVGFFNTGEAKLLHGAEPVLAHVAQVLATGGFQIRVEGHTDDVPIHNSHYHSNWELSTARATEVVLMMVQKSGFRPDRVSVAGYAQYRPVASNDTEEGRRRNRRIDLVVIALNPPAPSLGLTPTAVPGKQ